MGHRPPVAFREPYSLFADAVDRRCHDRSDKDVIAEEILVFECICFIAFGILIVHRTADAYTRVVALASHGVKIREQGITQFDRRIELRKVIVGPYLAVNPSAYGGMAAEYRGEYSELEPAEQKLGIVHRVIAVIHVSSDIMSPVSVADI